MNLPQELKDFLSNDSQLKYDFSESECGAIRLLSLNQLREDAIDVEMAECFYSSEEQHQCGPWGKYQIKVVNLVASCDGYTSEYILLFIPKENVFGAYDADHSSLIIFPNAKWADIVKSPLNYINAQWDGVDGIFAQEFDPREKYEISYENA
ncbi:hypothetical protein [Microbulbifer sp. ALW1]|uniref:hypothetical protein n=1 Tax=Microbulbifer sp. (strain ALW1) TaxID=1516059 RepID=UPI00135CD8F3|nr:hypothetical protein [Microbulbifer sp. ALW1]